MTKRFNPFDIYTDEDDIRDPTVRNFSSQKKEGEDFSTDDSRPGVLHIAVQLKRIQLIFLILTISLFLLLVRTLYLQIIEGENYRSSAEENRIRIQTVSAPRGVIYDKSNTLLVQNIPNFTVFIVPADLPEDQSAKDKIFQEVSGLIGITPQEIYQTLEEIPKYSYQPVKIAEQIPYEKALLLNIKSVNLPGILFEARASREYLMGPDFSGILGYVGSLTKEEYDLYQAEGYLFSDIIGKTGLEKSYESILRGTNGKQQIEVDSLGKEKKVLARNDPASGKNLILSVDHELQSRLASGLEKTIKSTGAPAAAAVALDPRNGQVLSIVSLPQYDNNAFIQGISGEEFEKILADPNNPLFFRATSSEYPSGSAIKPIIAAAALQEGIITSNTTINSVGGIRIGDFYYPDWKSGGHGRTNVKKALAESVNTFFYYVGGGFDDFPGLGVTRITDYMKMFYLGRVTGIDLPNEATGMVPDQEFRDATNREWYLGDTYHLSIGQGDILVTPLQVALYTSTIANGGTVYQPTIVQEIIDPLTNQKEVITPAILAQGFINRDYINTVRNGLRQAVTNGSARSLSSLPIAVAGKTGTAQFGKEDKTHAWFTCFAPLDAPEIVITVIIEEGGEGSDTALPVAKEILNWYFTN